MRAPLSVILVLLMLSSCSDDGTGSNVVLSDGGMDSQADVSTGGDADAGADASEVDVDEPTLFDTFEVRTCRDQLDGSVTLYAEHQDPPGCLLVTFEEVEETGNGAIETNAGWRLLASSVTDAPGCSTNIPGDHATRPSVDVMSGSFLLKFTVGGFPMGVLNAQLQARVSAAEGNPFGDAVLKVQDADSIVYLCPGGGVDG